MRLSQWGKQKMQQKTRANIASSRDKFLALVIYKLFSLTQPLVIFLYNWLLNFWLLHVDTGVSAATSYVNDETSEDGGQLFTLPAQGKRKYKQKGIMVFEIGDS